MTALWSDPVVVRYIGGAPQTANETWGRLLRYVGHWQLNGYGFWAVEERATGSYIGDVGFADFQRATKPRLDAVPEAGWVLAAHGHGKGYALEAMRAALTWMDPRAARTQCIINHENLASQRLAAKLGFVESHDVEHGDERVRVWARQV